MFFGKLKLLCFWSFNFLTEDVTFGDSKLLSKFHSLLLSGLRPPIQALFCMFYFISCFIFFNFVISAAIYFVLAIIYFWFAAGDIDFLLICLTSCTIFLANISLINCFWMPCFRTSDMMPLVLFPPLVYGFSLWCLINLSKLIFTDSKIEQILSHSEVSFLKVLIFTIYFDIFIKTLKFDIFWCVKSTISNILLIFESN